MSWRRRSPFHYYPSGRCDPSQRSPRARYYQKGLKSCIGRKTNFRRHRSKRPRLASRLSTVRLCNQRFQRRPGIHALTKSPELNILTGTNVYTVGWGIPLLWNIAVVRAALVKLHVKDLADAAKYRLSGVATSHTPRACVGEPGLA